MLKGWGALAAVLMATSAQAHEQGDRGRDTAAASVEHFAIDAGVHTMILFGSSCARTDLVECQDGRVAMGAHIAPALYFTPHWSLGVRGAATFSGSASDGLLTFWQVEAEGRYHFVNRGRTDAWLGADAGILMTTEHVENDELGPPATLTSTSPMFGLAAGAGFRIADAFRLGAEWRGIFNPRSTSAYQFGGRGTTFEDQWGIVLGVTGTVLFGG